MKTVQKLVVLGLIICSLTACFTNKNIGILKGQIFLNKKECIYQNGVCLVAVTTPEEYKENFDATVTMTSGFTHVDFETQNCLVMKAQLNETNKRLVIRSKKIKDGVLTIRYAIGSYKHHSKPPYTSVKRWYVTKKVKKVKLISDGKVTYEMDIE